MEINLKDLPLDCRSFRLVEADRDVVAREGITCFASCACELCSKLMLLCAALVFEPGSLCSLLFASPTI